uniref:DNA-directed RNA polymerase n=1 Tax=Rhizochromulina marina TaxID=1034831 RepID=A0A514CPY7_9STRA|nr:RNA polymerase beta'' subunit [Rhizochromulina marina]QDH81873.1 RNA polymerase beta'' subunit [Rhizochromulina marina]
MKHLAFKNKIFTKKELKQVMYETFTNYGLKQASYLADNLKSLGFQYATKAGISISVEDLKITPTKSEILRMAQTEIRLSNDRYVRGEISSIERFQTVINVWNNTSESIKDSLVDYFTQTDPLNSIYLMAFSGARGNLSQVRQLVGMRGLMSDPNGQIIDIPIVHNFREGLTITDYIMSSYGARKGVVDTALKTADSGYLTRRLVDVAQDVIIREYDCSTSRSIKLNSKRFSKKALLEKIVGRTCGRNFRQNSTQFRAFAHDQQITKLMALDLLNQNEDFDIWIRSPLTCESMRSVCQLCYGWNLASGDLVNLGSAIGIIAAQSIGEPGTQLTMRTFHTGGIFTADPSRQIRAQESGLLRIPSDLKFRQGRTVYGTNIKILDQSTNLGLVSYANHKTTVLLPPNSSLFLSSETFVKKGQLIAELPLTSQQTLRAKKFIFAPNSGEVVPCVEKELVWVLQGRVYEIPSQSLLNNLGLYFSSLNIHDNFVTLKLTTRTSGMLKLGARLVVEKVIKIINSLAFFNSPIFYDPALEMFVFLSKSKDFYQISPDYFKKQHSSLNFQMLASQFYDVPTSGYIFLRKESNSSTLCNRNLLYLPEERYVINRDRSLLLVEPMSELEIPGIELIKGTFARIAGFLQIKETHGILQEITIKPGKFIEYTNLKDSDLKLLRTFNNKLFYPGEVILSDILVESLSLIEFIYTPSCIGLLIRPVLDFYLPKSRFNNSVLYDIKNLDFVDNEIQFRYLAHSQHVRGPSGFNLVSSDLNLIFSEDTRLKFSQPSKQYATLNIVAEDTITLNNIVPKPFLLEQSYLSLNVRNFQFVEKNSVLGKLSLRINPAIATQLETFALQDQDNGVGKVLFTTKSDYFTCYSERPVFSLIPSLFLKKGDFLLKGVHLVKSGMPTKISPFSITLRRGTPVFLKEGMVLYKGQGSFIKKDEALGLINFEQIITGDIVQGLPKIEEILEARKPQVSALLATSPGLVVEIETSSRQHFIGIKTIASRTSSYLLNTKKTSQDFIVAPNDYISLGQPITTGAVNPHLLLEVFFNFYKLLNPNYDAAYLSFKNLQLLLINKIQQVYNSQGVDIADKHLEIIVRQITSKVKITHPGATLLVQGEIMELRQVNYINVIMAQNRKKQANYSPLLLGITKASLLTDSFISAASFQETTKILTAAAIEGKVDWLRGLKENVIIGRLIPVGKGFTNEGNLGLKELTFC